MKNNLDGRNGRASGSSKVFPCVNVIGKGGVLACYFDDKTIEAMRSERWTHVNIGFKGFDEIVFVKSTDGTGIKIRYYETERVNIHVTIKHYGIAKAKPNPPVCPVTRKGDAFILGIADQISIEPKSETEDEDPLDRMERLEGRYITNFQPK